MPSLDKILATENVATLLKGELLEKMGDKVVESTRMDNQSRQGWLDRNKEAIVLASQIKESKNFPWPKASNVKYPLITTAAIQFHARASQSLLSASRPVKAKPIGGDPTGSGKAARAELISKHMSHQVLHEMPHWQDENDRLLLLVAIIGMAFKKTHRCPIRNQNVSELVTPQNLVLSYYAKDFERCRKTEIYTLTKNQFIERMRRDIFLTEDLEDGNFQKQDQELDPFNNDKILGLEDPSDPLDDTTPYRFFDQYFEWDLDKDGYSEPYCVTVEESSGKVFRILKLFNENDVKFNERNEIFNITQEGSYANFTRFTFIPDIDSPLYAFGLGTLLNPLNASVNTLLNQLIDAGTLSTLQGGFLGRGVRLPKGGTTRFRPGEWKQVQTTGDDLRKGIFPLPVKEPSNVLFQLLGLLIQAGEEISSVADIMKGNNPGQNQPFSTTVAVLEQGMQVFTSIYKRLFRAFRTEYKHLYRLNATYLGAAEYINIIDPSTEEEVEVSKQLYEQEGVDVLPEADPDAMSQMERQLKAESLEGKVERGFPINPDEVLRRTLEAEGHEDIQALLDYEPPPNPEQEFKERELEMQMELEWAKLLLLAVESDSEEVKDASQAIANLARAVNFKESAQNEKMRILVDATLGGAKLESTEIMAELKADADVAIAKMKPNAPAN